MGGSIRVLHVDDEPDLAETAAAFLEREAERLDVVPVTDVDEALETLQDEEFDCLVSDYDMPRLNGIEFLERVREEYPEVPFILFTGKGSEEVASEAISAGVTDYLQKRGTPEQYSILANRIQNAVETTRAKASADRSRQRFEYLLEAFPDIALYVDEEGRCVDVIAGGETQLLYDDPQEVLGSRYDELFPDEQAARFQETLETALRTDEVQSIEYELDVQAGTRWFEARIAPLDTGTHDPEMVLWVARDITDRQEREQTLETLHEIATTIQSAETVEAAAEQTVTAAEDILEFELCTLVIREGEWLVPYANATRAGPDASRPMRIDQGLAGRTYQSGETHVVDEVRSDDESDPAKDDFRSGISVPIGEYGVFQAVSTEPDAFDDEDVTLLELLVSHTQTAIERIERERTLTRKTERLDDFASFVSHDLRNPLNVATLRLDLASQECDSPHLDDVDDALERMTELIETLLTMARHGDSVGELEEMQVDDVVNRCWKTLETGDAAIECETDAVIVADESQLVTVFENLFRNAVTHGSQDVTIFVGTLEDNAGIYVADDGAGLKADPDQIFQTGFSTKEQGTGYGLTIVKDIVDAHGWEIDVTESATGGARFELRGVEFPYREFD